MEEETEEKKVVVKKVAIAIVTLIVVIILWPITIINATSKGLLFKFGALQDEVLDSGIHFILPIRDRVKEVTIQPIQLDHRVEVGKDGAITKDNQTIGAEITVFYKYKADNLTTMYRQYGEEKMKSIVNQTLRESFKTIIGGYDIFKLPTIQDEIRGKVWQDFQSKLTVYPIEVTELKIVNYDWSDQFDAQIAETMNRSQQVKQKEQELLISQNEQQKKVKEADAEKQATVVRAEGARDAAKLQAEAKALEGEGIKKYNESIASKWDIELKKMELEIAKIKAEKWNGVFVPSQVFTPIPLDLKGTIQGDK